MKKISSRGKWYELIFKPKKERISPSNWNEVQEKLAGFAEDLLNYVHGLNKDSGYMYESSTHYRNIRNASSKEDVYGVWLYGYKGHSENAQFVPLIDVEYPT